jgi:hypothetical protein
MRPLYRLLALPSGERRLLLEAAFLLAVIRLALGRLPFQMLRRLVVRLPRNGRELASTERTLADQVVWAVTAASQRAPGWMTCLVRGLAVQAMLARRGYATRLHVGVGRGSQGELEAHAWVIGAGRILIGGTAAEVARFSPLAAFDVEAMNRPTVVALEAGR